jgi:hypothetical protein
VQVDVDATRATFWWGGSVGSVLTNLINLHCSVDVLVPSSAQAAQSRSYFFF